MEQNLDNRHPSPRRLGPQPAHPPWIPACAGMTGKCHQSLAWPAQGKGPGVRSGPPPAETPALVRGAEGDIGPLWSPRFAGGRAQRAAPLLCALCGPQKPSGRGLWGGRRTTATGPERTARGLALRAACRTRPIDRRARLAALARNAAVPGRPTRRLWPPPGLGLRTAWQTPRH